MINTKGTTKQRSKIVSFPTYCHIVREGGGKIEKHESRHTGILITTTSPWAALPHPATPPQSRKNAIETEK